MNLFYIVIHKTVILNINNISELNNNELAELQEKIYSGLLNIILIMCYEYKKKSYE